MAAITSAAIAAGGAAYAANKNSKTQKSIAKTNSPANQANAQAAASNTNQYTPYGSSEWNITGQNPDGTNIYENRQSLSPEMQKQFDWGNKNAESSLGAQNNYLSQINENSKTPLSASSLSGKIDYGTGADGAQKYADSLSYGAGNAATMSDTAPINANTYNASTYNGKGYDANTYQGKGYDANTYQGKGYDANTYQGKGYDAKDYNANTYTARELGQAAQATAASAGTERAAYGKIQDNLRLSGDALKSDLDTTRDAYYNTQKSYLDPQWENDNRAMETKLANQGIAMNSAAYNDAMAAFNRNREFAYNNARNTSITGAGAEQSRLFGLDLESGKFANSAQQQGFDQSAWNAGQANNASIANAQMATNVNVSNTEAKNANRQFNANNFNDAARYNTGAMNDASRYSADAANRSSEYNAGAINDASRYNTGAMNDAGRYGADALNRSSEYNTGAMNDAGRYGADALNRSSEYNTGAMNDAGRYGADALNRSSEYNTGAMNDASRYGADANNEMSQFNAGMSADRDRFNAGARNDFSQFNANLNNSAQNNAYNARLAASEQNNSALNQEMQQLFAFRNQPMDEYNSLRQGMSMPQANFDNGGGSNFNAAQAMQASAQQQMAAANNQAQGNAAMWGQVGNLAGMGIDAWQGNRNAKYDKWASEAAWD